jgi:arylsulfatase A-like enzyme
LFWHYPHYGNQGGAPAAAIRKGGWKLIEWQEDGRLELFDLTRDPSETRNLATREPGRVNTLLRQLRAWQRDVGARVPEPNPSFDRQRADGRASPRP